MIHIDNLEQDFSDCLTGFFFCFFYFKLPNAKSR